ncbi:hypothetical protein BVC80_1831g115 [Macleaya cordata]|uniref:RNase H type-1 domain-containing protein n=1 Tax=Macleaya cordata TaxID=56857 RepID=A0A200R787_MACCD|nr:hypothetical protein BVC80_1831g115 [Macleaya cordata]
MSEPVDWYRRGQFGDVLRERDTNVIPYGDPHCATPYYSPPCFTPYYNPPGFTSDDNPPCFAHSVHSPAFAPYVKPPCLTPYVNSPGFATYVNPPVFAPFVNPPGLAPYGDPPGLAPYGDPSGLAPYNSDGYETYDNDDDSGSDAVEYWDGGEADLPQCAATQLAFFKISAKTHQADIPKCGTTQQADLCSKKKKHSASRYSTSGSSGSSSLSSVNTNKKKKNKKKKKRRQNKKKILQNYQYEEDEELQRAEEDQQDEQSISSDVLYIVHTDGCFRKGEKGGYGAILLDNHGKPIVAAAGVSERPLSVLYHQLQGVKRGLELAKKHGCLRVKVLCNSKYAVGVTNGSSAPVLFDCHSLVARILEEIVLMRSEFTSFSINPIPREFNRAADYLAKLGKTIEIESTDFPRELEKLVCEDADAAGNYRNFL